MMKRLFLLLILLPLFTGCSSSYEDVVAKMDAIRKSTSHHIEPVPDFVPLPQFPYAAHQLRSPFSPPLSSEEKAMLASGKKIEPDFGRPQEYLERFNIEALLMKGILQKNGPMFALVQDGNGTIQRVKVGNYLGKNQGKIVDISPTQITVVEVVPDGRDGWVERRRTINLPE
jgi:type IV pilus assembly protein PilP